MVNNTVKKTGKAAGYADATIITGLQVKQTKKELEAVGKVNRAGKVTGEFISIKAYPGGNPNKNKNRSNEEMTH